MVNKRNYLTVFSLIMITVVSVDSIRNLPSTAMLGSQLISFFVLGSIFFLIPTALVSAELASRFSSHSGVYVWVKEAFGKHLGFLAIWLQWIENVIWYPTILSFVAGTIGYLIDPMLAKNPYFLWLVIVVSFWSATFVNLKGMQASALLSNICAISGLLIPMSFIIVLGTIWCLGGNTIQVNFDLKSILPHWQDRSMWVSLTAVMMSFCGIEIATIHANEVQNPQHAFPKALLYSVGIILSTLILGSLAIAIVLPNKDINLVAGIMQAFDAFFAKYHLGGLMPLVAVMLVLGGLGGVSNWIIAPTKGLLIAANDGNLPSMFQSMNDKGAPSSLLICQAVIVTLLAGLFLFMPTVNASYWLLTALAAQLYMIMYFLMFIAAIKLRWKLAAKDPKTFHIPGGMLGLTIVSILGIIGVIVTIIVSFIPPEGSAIGSVSRYEFTLISGLILMCSPPFIFIKFQKKRERSITCCA